MLTLYRQESFKLLKKKSTLWISILLAVVTFGVALLGRLKPTIFPAKQFFQLNFISAPFLVLFMIAATASIITMETQYGTIKNVLSQRYSRTQVLISKWLVMLTYSVYLYVMTSVLALIGKFIFVNNKFSLTDKGDVHQIWLDWLITLSSNFLTVWLLLSLVFLMATLFKSSAAAISIGIIGYFALSLLNGFLVVLINLYEWVKWNPLNFLNYPAQLNNPALSQITKLSTTQLFWGNVCYIILFLLIDWLIFRKRNV
ncbi:ABC transporter permease subunit [Lactiplantibacillus argentoratensis]|uniref:ABC transporter permease n=1 Tax=Lactiplantibacillus paraplantarum TaxID=60520 RepID=A0A4Q9XXF9_9LACO|nr:MULTISPECIES: ABC transporter permease [Lactiplantibacillus]TBX32865.1 ABC transporter permease [Lactiplantibacillus paraplantarum]MBT1145105.1 ABC transporter permease subunit [Lactiplantibacillus argentoratensis]MBT1147966.1 ABC transporter permease subunit [Lactiplantibacillus argentoratensis]MBT1150779.1 ABC transporter permease subunit [Lactiplantibacillus argentoratensis]MBT1153915.1 ABC transporter permease subunit [Lactiplantibacillus argentoratensis]